MTWYVAILVGATIGLVYCAVLRHALNWSFKSGREIKRGREGERERGRLGKSPALPFAPSPTRHPLVWFALTSAARVALVGALFANLAMFGADTALFALLGFSLVHGIVVASVSSHVTTTH